MRIELAGLCLIASLAFTGDASAAANSERPSGPAAQAGDTIRLALARKAPAKPSAAETPSTPAATTGETPPSAPSDGMGATTAPATPSVAAAPPLFDANAAPKRTIGDCMKTWDKATHMSKTEWRATCIRSMKEAEKHDRQSAAEQKVRDKAKKKVN